MKQTINLLALLLFLSGCTPHIDIVPPKEPIMINMNVKIEHEIRIKVDRDLEHLLNSEPNLF